MVFFFFFCCFVYLCAKLTQLKKLNLNTTNPCDGTQCSFSLLSVWFDPLIAFLWRWGWSIISSFMISYISSSSFTVSALLLPLSTEAVSSLSFYKNLWGFWWIHFTTRTSYITSYHMLSLLFLNISCYFLLFLSFHHSMLKL